METEESIDIPIILFLGVMLFVGLTLLWPLHSTNQQNNTTTVNETVSEAELFCTSIIIPNMILVATSDYKSSGGDVFCKYETRREHPYRSCIIMAERTANHGIVETKRGCK